MSCNTATGAVTQQHQQAAELRKLTWLQTWCWSSDSWAQYQSSEVNITHWVSGRVNYCTTAALSVDTWWHTPTADKTVYLSPGKDQGFKDRAKRFIQLTFIAGFVLLSFSVVDLILCIIRTKSVPLFACCYEWTFTTRKSLLPPDIVRCTYFFLFRIAW